MALIQRITPKEQMQMGFLAAGGSVFQPNGYGLPCAQGDGFGNASSSAPPTVDFLELRAFPLVNDQLSAHPQPDFTPRGLLAVLLTVSIDDKGKGLTKRRLAEAGPAGGDVPISHLPSPTSGLGRHFTVIAPHGAEPELCVLSSKFRFSAQIAVGKVFSPQTGALPPGRAAPLADMEFAALPLPVFPSTDAVDERAVIRYSSPERRCFFLYSPGGEGREEAAAWCLHDQAQVIVVAEDAVVGQVGQAVVRARAIKRAGEQAVACPHGGRLDCVNHHQATPHFAQDAANLGELPRWPVLRRGVEADRPVEPPGGVPPVEPAGAGGVVGRSLGREVRFVPIRRGVADGV